jgi:hypothetical protein
MEGKYTKNGLLTQMRAQNFCCSHGNVYLESLQEIWNFGTNSGPLMVQPRTYSLGSSFKNSPDREKLFLFRKFDIDPLSCLLYCQQERKGLRKLIIAVGVVLPVYALLSPFSSSWFSDLHELYFVTAHKCPLFHFPFSIPSSSMATP